jgi:hypothetical protein
MNNWVRKLHRMVALVFTLVVFVVTIAMMGDEPPAQWVYLMPLPLLGLLWLSGIYLYVLPYFAKKRKARIGATGLTD